MVRVPVPPEGLIDSAGNVEGAAGDTAGAALVHIVANDAGSATSANQATEISDLAAISTVEGATADAAVTSNAVGTVSAKLRGLVAILADVWVSASHWLKFSLENLGVKGQATMANSLPVVVASDQSAVPISGTVTVDTSLLSTAAKQDDGNTYLGSVDGKTPALGQAALAASVPVAIASNQSAVPVSGTFWQAVQTVSGTLLSAIQSIPARPANTTAYAAKQAYNMAPHTITAATNASPCVVTDVAHGFSTGQAIGISGAVGNTAVNGTWLVVVVDVDHYTLTNISGAAVNGNGAWSSGGSVIMLLTFANIARTAGGHGNITKAKLSLDGVAMTGTWELWLYNALVTPLADQATFTTLRADSSARVGHIAFTPVSGGTGSDCTFGQATPNDVGSHLPLEYTADPNKNLYGILVSNGTPTPISGGAAIVHLSGDAY